MKRLISLALSAKGKKHNKKKSQDRSHNAWLTENQAAIDQYNKRIKRRGAFSDEWRRF